MELHSRVVCVNDTATTEIYTLSLHDALPISAAPQRVDVPDREARLQLVGLGLCQRALRKRVVAVVVLDRKSTRLNSSHANISYAVFCLKKKTPILPRPFALSSPLPLSLPSSF